MRRLLARAGLALALLVAALAPTAAQINNAPLANAGVAGNVRFSAQSATVVQACPYQGNKVQIGGAVYAVPAACVTTTNGGLSSGTLYYGYLFLSGSSLALELSTTGHITSSLTGVEVKSGDSSRTLVGALYSNGSSQFVDSSAQRLVASWFNRRLKAIQGAQTSAVTLTATSPTEIASAARIEYLAWSDDTAYGALFGNAANNTASSTCFGYIGVDGTPGGIGSSNQLSGVSEQAAINAVYNETSGSDVHRTLSPFGQATAATTCSYSVGVWGVIRN